MNYLYQLRLLIGGCIYPSTEKNIKDFDMIDANRDNQISMDEFLNYFFRIKKRSPTNEEWMKFHFSDKRNDGFLTFSEFTNYINKEFV